MKKIIPIIVLACFAFNFMNAQSRKGYIAGHSSIEECKKYFKDNILDLDPIEGIYDLKITQQGKNSFVTFPATEESERFVIYKTSAGKYQIQSFNKISIKRIGETNAYNWVTQWPEVAIVDEVRFLLNNNLHFCVKTEVPAAQIKKDQGRNYQAGMRVTFVFNGIKEYPTGTMYSEAARKETENILQEEKRRMEEAAKKAGWTGTGFALKDGYIVTNYHVIEDAINITIQGVKGDFANKLTAQVVASDKYNDIAILKINDSRFTGFGTIPYLVKTSISDVAEDVFVLGYPMTTTMGDEIKYTTGVISSKTGFQGDVSQYQISAPVQPGNSGGPLFDSKGNVIGIVSAKHTGAENVGYAIKTSYLKNLIESVLSTNILPVTNTGIQTLSNAEKVKKIKSFVFLINASTQTTTSTQRHTNPTTSASNSTPVPSTSTNQTYTSKVEGTTPKTSNPGASNSFVNKKGERIVQSKEATIKVGDLVYAELEGKQVERWEISSSAASFVATQDKYKLKVLKEGNVQVWGYIDGSPKLFKLKIVNTNTTLPGDKPIKTITSKECTIDVGDHITAKLPEGDVERWEITNLQGEYVDIGQHILVAKKSGIISVWGYINNSPRLFKITIQ